MNSARAKWLTVLTFAMACRCMHAQSPAYHVELSSDASPSHVFVNDGPVPVDGFAMSVRCGENSSSSATSDWLDIDGGESTSDSSMIRLPQHQRGQHNLVAQGDAYRTFIPAVQGNKPCYAKVEAVIFSDGSTDGDPVWLAEMQAARDGYSDEVNFWFERLNAEDPQAPGWEALSAESEKRAGVALKKLRATHFQPEHDMAPDPGRAYWSARMLVANSMGRAARLRAKQPEGFGYMHNRIIGWKDKIDSDKAKATLDLRYPLPSALRTEAAAAYPLARTSPLAPEH